MKTNYTVRAVAGLCLALVPALTASGPAWWAHYGVLDAAQPGDNYSPINVGQLKQIAAQAKAYLDATDGASPGSAIASLVAGFSQNDPENFAPANVGQLITVARVFYDHLNSLVGDPDVSLTRESLILNGYPASWNHDYFWDPSTDPAELHAPVNIGQLKLVFSFDLHRDSNGDGLSDFFKWQNGLNVLVVSPDGQSWTHAFDTNGDGLRDADYVTYHDPDAPWPGYGGLDAATATGGPSPLVIFGPN